MSKDEDASRRCLASAQKTEATEATETRARAQGQEDNRFLSEVTIKSNDRIGHEIERLIAQDFNVLSINENRGSFDLETPTELVEVKSCRPECISHEARQSTGRFIIGLSSHRKLRDEALAHGKTPFYLFVLYESNPVVTIIAKQMCTWEQVDEKLSDAVVYRRGDGLEYVALPYTRFIRQSRL